LMCDMHHDSTLCSGVYFIVTLQIVSFPLEGSGHMYCGDIAVSIA